MICLPEAEQDVVSQRTPAPRKFGCGRLLSVACVMIAVWAVGAPASVAAQPQVFDRAVLRYFAPDLGGSPTPQFIFERELAFEARLQALADPDQSRDSALPYLGRHVRSAVERHIAESLMANLRVDPPPTEAELNRQTDDARKMLCDRIGSSASLDAAAKAEGISDREVTILLRRQARASIYLDRMVAPMLAPTRTELRQVYAVERHPFTQSSFEEVEPLLRNWWIGHRLSDAVEQYFANARQRVVVTLLANASTDTNEPDAR